MQISTKGILNKINELYYCSSKKRSVPVQQLIRNHNIKSKRHLIAAIEYHSTHRCSCGVTSKGTIEDFARNLWVAYQDYETKTQKKYGKTHEDCLIFIRNLFVDLSLKGNSMEEKAKTLLNSMGINCDMSTELEDFKYAVDLIVTNGDTTLGVQVKPKSYKLFEKNHPIVQQNIQKNNKYPHEVVYIYYDASPYDKCESFEGIENIITKMK
jgi:hypothetical protein